ncbi:MAG: carbonic anhydrase [Acidimicrobiia bacterium]|nr:carbonic anhydrase [Acidimicrobiia bacterium]
MPETDFTPNAEEVLSHNIDVAKHFEDADLAAEPNRALAVVACMDSRLDTFKTLGLAVGEAHIIRNAGGIITDDVVRSLCLSQRKLGTREIILVHHTDCGLQKIDEADFRRALEAETGLKPRWSLETFADPYADVRQSMRRLSLNPFLLHKDHIRGFVYDVTDGLLREVGADC